MSSWQDELPAVLNEKRRWVVLRHLEASAPQRELSIEILKSGCRAAGIQTTTEQIEGTVQWLHDQALITIERLGPMLTAKLNKDGREVAQGHRTVPGIIVFELDI